MSRISLLLLFFPFLLLSCKTNDNDSQANKDNIYDLDKVNVGEIELYADHKAQYLLDQLQTIYSAHFPESQLQITYKDDKEVMDAIYSDSVRLIVLMRECSTHELNKLNSIYNSKPVQHTFAYDAIALVRDKSSSDTLLGQNELDQLIQDASDLFVTVSQYSGLFNHFLRIQGVTEGSRNINVVRDIDELQLFLRENPNYIGILPFSLISNQNTEEVKSITRKFRWLGINMDDDEIYPSQSTIYTKEWPLILPYTIIYSRLSSYKGVGFVKFVHNRQSAKLILKAGLIPVNMPERLIRIEDQSFNL